MPTFAPGGVAAIGGCTAWGNVSIEASSSLGSCEVACPRVDSAQHHAFDSGEHDISSTRAVWMRHRTPAACCIAQPSSKAILPCRSESLDHRSCIVAHPGAPRCGHRCLKGTQRSCGRVVASCLCDARD